MITKNFKFHPQPSSLRKSTIVAKKFNMRGKKVLDCFCGTGTHGVAAISCGAIQFIGTDIEDYSFCLRKDIARFNHNHKTFGEKAVHFEWGKEALKSISEYEFDILFVDPPNPFQVAGGTTLSMVRDTGMSGSKLTKFWNERFSEFNLINKKQKTIDYVIDLFNKVLNNDKKIVANLFIIKSNKFNYCDNMNQFKLFKIYDSYFEVKN
jgi:16S rRNA G966 N2-methylase RsmD